MFYPVLFNELLLQAVQINKIDQNLRFQEIFFRANFVVDLRLLRLAVETRLCL